MVEEPRIRIDEDWKEQAEAEKRQLDESIGSSKGATAGAAGVGRDSTAAAPEPAGGAGNSRVSLLVLVEQLAAQAMTCLGQMPDPRTGETFLELGMARETIDLIGVLEEKTRGNLTEEEQRVMGDVLHSLRAGYTSVSRAAAQRAMQGDPGAGSAGDGPEGDGPGGGSPRGEGGKASP